MNTRIPALQAANGRLAQQLQDILEEAGQPVPVQLRQYAAVTGGGGGGGGGALRAFAPCAAAKKLQGLWEAECAVLEGRALWLCACSMQGLLRVCVGN